MHLVFERKKEAVDDYLINIMQGDIANSFTREWKFMTIVSSRYTYTAIVQVVGNYFEEEKISQ